MRTRHLGIALAASLLAVAIGARRAGPWSQPAGEAAAIRAARGAQNRAIAERDLGRVASFWTEDVAVTAGLGRVLQGRAVYRRAFELDSAVVYRREPERVEVSAGWPLAFETGAWSGRPAGGGAPLMRGRYAAQWVKRGGRWLIRSELFVALACSGPACGWPVASP